MNKTGFTLMEMLVVVLIMGILAAIAIPQYQQVVYKARFVKLMPIVKALKNAEEEYWLANRRYAYDFGELGFRAQGFQPSAVSSQAPTRRSHLVNGNQRLEIFENGGGTPVVSGSILNRAGTSSVQYLIYLNKCDHGDCAGQNATIRARRYCYSNTEDRNDWRYKLCASLTGSSAPQADWEGNPRFEFR